MTILVTGAAGYVGSHASLRLLREGHAVIGLDNYCTGQRERPIRLAQLAPGLPGSFEMIEGDIADIAIVSQAIAQHGVDAVMHFAAHCIVSESVREPEKYHRNNAQGTAALLSACGNTQITRFILSSTTSVYGDPNLGMTPIPESTPCHPINPYGASKIECERLLRSHARSNPHAAIAALRYFNVAGCDPELGEQSNDAGRLIPAAINVALGKQEALTICGSDFPTPDGTCVRDYVDVRDIADAHVAVLGALKPGDQPGDQRCYNIGMGKGWSVREVAEATARISGRDVPTIDGPRRDGDPPALVADVTKIANEIGWKAKHTELDDVIGSVWSWAQSR